MRQKIRRERTGSFGRMDPGFAADGTGGLE